MKNLFSSRFTAIVLASSASLLSALPTSAQDKVTFLTNWYAQAEHGGFYQAVATGLYKKYGLDVTIKMGGPQVNGMQLLAAGQADFFMGYDIQTMKGWEQGLQSVTLAAAFQKDPQVLMSHPGVNSPADFKGKSILISSAANTTWWPWAKAKWGLEDSQARPYTFNIQPFMADKNLVQQGYLSSEPFAVAKAGVKPNVYLMADYGYPPYSTTIVGMASTVAAKPKMVEAFVKASMEGWKSYLADPTAANALIKKDNPNMTDDQLAYGVAKLKEMGIVTGGDAAKMGIGAMTDERMKATFDMLVANKLIDPSKVDLKKTYTLQFVKDLKVLP